MTITTKGYLNMEADKQQQGLVKQFMSQTGAEQTFNQIIPWEKRLTHTQTKDHRQEEPKQEMSIPGLSQA